MSGLDSAKVKNSVVSAAFIYGRRAAAEGNVRGKGLHWVRGGGDVLGGMLREPFTQSCKNITGALL